jgi:hypothetical protein
MPTNAAANLAALESLKRNFGSAEKNIQRLLKTLAASKLTDADQLIGLHETLLFYRAYPPSARVLKQVEKILSGFAARVSELRAAEVDLSPLDDPEVSGIAGTSVTSNFSYAIVHWLTKKYPAQLSVDWDWFEEEDRFGATMPRFVPLLEDDAMVEAHVPYRAWLRAAVGRHREVSWLISQFESLRLADRRKAELYDALKLHVTWRFGVQVSRTAMKRRPREIFFHNEPLIARRDVSIAAELSSRVPIPTAKLSRAEGERVLDLFRETSGVRYRELHGFTYGDPQRVLKADIGRGTEAFVMGVPAENRLPLRAYHAALILKNGVPVSYFEGLSLCERMESGFNLYYTFREGETAWLYARILKLMRQLFGVTVFSIDPYQVGHENEEGIESGAFWFYRKLGFRPVTPELMKLTLSEEKKMAADRDYRSSPRVLRKLAAGPMLFEMAGSTSGHWDRFAVRNVGLAVQRQMAREFDSDPRRARAESAQIVKRALKINPRRWRPPEIAALENLSLVLAMVPELGKWNETAKVLMTRIIRAKAGNDEALYLKLTQQHAAWRGVLKEFGS